MGWVRQLRWSYVRDYGSRAVMRILVVGTRQVDAGKTTFTRGLMVAMGMPAFKPRAANDRWYSYDTYHRAIDDGRLYGRDAMRVAAGREGDVAPEDVNPIHRLWRPVNDPDGGIHGRPNRRFLVDRGGVTTRSHQYRTRGFPPDRPGLPGGI